MANQGLVVFGEVGEGGNVLLRDYQEVHGGLRRDIVEGDDVIVFIELARGNLPGGDFAEQTVHGNSPACYKRSRV
ncbi:hypothetical protein D9M72_184990 [compost metagenome]